MLVTKTVTSLHFTALHSTSLHLSTLHFCRFSNLPFFFFMLKPRVISGDSFRGKSVSWWETHSCWERWTWCHLPTILGDYLYKQFWQARGSLFVNNNYIRVTPTICQSIYCWSLTLTSHCLSHLLLLLLLLLIPLSVIIWIFSPLCYTLPFTKTPTPPFVYICTSSEGHVSFSFFESVLAKKHSCVFYPFLHFQRLFSLTFRHLSFCLL